MKRIFIINLKKLLIPLLLVILIGGIILIKEIITEIAINTSIGIVNGPSKTYFEPDTPIKGSLEEIYKDVSMGLLTPHIHKAVSDHYEKNTGFSPNVDPWDINILSIERPNGYRTFLFVIKIEVSPYLGAHNAIGVDHLTIRVSSGEVEVEKFEHIKSYSIPPNYRN